MITTEQIKALRDATGVSIMQCKKALEEAGGDAEKASIILRKKSGAVAEKKANRSLGAGAVASYVHSSGAVGTMIVLACETDFVAKNDDFKSLAREIAMHITAMNPEYRTKNDIDEIAQTKATEVFQEEVADKPKNLQEKILLGKLDAYFKEKTLIEQPFIKDATMTIGQMIESAIQKFGERIEVAEFKRMSI